MVEILRSVRIEIVVETSKRSVREICYDAEEAIKVLERLRKGELIEGIYA